MCQNKMYLVHVNKHEPDKSYTFDYKICDTFDECVSYANKSLNDECYNRGFSEDYVYVTKKEYETFIRESEKIGISYTADIITFSTNRKKFETVKDLMEYYNKNIKNISDEDLYDFLLSLVENFCTTYDHDGNIIGAHVTTQSFSKEKVYRLNVDFNEEDCKKGMYTFEYNFK